MHSHMLDIHYECIIHSKLKLITHAKNQPYLHKLATVPKWLLTHIHNLSEGLTFSHIIFVAILHGLMCNLIYVCMTSQETL